MKNFRFKQKLRILIVLFVLLLPLRGFAQTDDTELFFVAQKAFEDGFYDVAVRYINQIIEQYPTSSKLIESKLLLGQCYFFQAQYLKAYDIFQSLTQYNEFKDVTLFWLAETYAKGSDFKQAQEQYTQLINLYPDSAYAPHAYYSLGWLYFDQDKLDDAKRVFSEFIRRFPSHQLAEDAAYKLGEIYYNKRDFDDTIKHFRSYIDNFPKSSKLAEAYFYVGDSYYYKEDFLDALTYYAKASELAYESNLIFMSKVSMGWCYLKLSKYKLSEQYFGEALKLSLEKNIKSDDIFLGMANLYTETGDYGKALESYDKILTEFSDSDRILEAYYGKANIFYLKKQYDQAVKNFRILLELYANKDKHSDSDEDIFEKTNFGIAWAYLKLGEIDLSIKSFEKIRETTSNRIVKISALTQIGDAYQDIEKFEKAVGIYDQILKEYPDSPYTDYVQYRQAIALLRMDKVEAATLSFQTLQANFPNSKYLKDAKYYLGLAYFKLGNWTNAQKQTAEFIAVNKNDVTLMPEAYYILGLSYFNLNDFGNAVKTFDKLVSSFPNQIAMVKNAELNIAKSNYKLNNTKQAIKQFEALVAKYPDSEVAQESLIWIGDYYLETSDYASAINYYTSFIDKFKGSENVNHVYYSLGQAYQLSEKYGEAVNSYKNVKYESGKEIFAKAKLAIAAILSKNFDYESAKQVYQTILSTAPEYARDAYIKLADVYKESKEYDKVIECYQKALKEKQALVSMSNAELQFALADTQEILNNEDKAVEEYFKIPYLYPNDKNWIIKAYLRIARIYENQENWQKAVTVYNNIIDYNSDETKFAKERLDWISENVKK